MNISFLINHKWVILFYSFIFLWVYFNRKKFEFQAKIIAFYRTQVGIEFINKFSEKFKEWIKLLGYIGVGIGFVAMIYISGLIVSSFFNLFLRPEAPSAIAPALPGVKIPGSPIFIPFWYGIISIFFVTIIHEAAHGIVAKAHNLKINSTGIAFIGPLIAAFVEPDEAKLKEQSDIIRYSIFAAGPFSNMLFALLAILLIQFVVNPIQSNMLMTDGFSFYSITPFSPAFNASVPAHTIFTRINDININSEKEFLSTLDNLKPNQKIKISNDKLVYEFSTIEHPNRPDKALIGISGSANGKIIQIHKSDQPINKNLDSRFFMTILNTSRELLFWIFVLSSGIGIANLLPLGPVDGGRMLQVALLNLTNKEKANKIFTKISFVTFVLVIISFFFPIVRAILRSFNVPI